MRDAGLPGEEVVPPLLVTAPEALVRCEEGWLVHVVKSGKVAGEDDPACDCDVILLAAAEPADGVVVVHVADARKYTVLSSLPCVPPRTLRDGHLEPGACSGHIVSCNRDAGN